MSKPLSIDKAVDKHLKPVKDSDGSMTALEISTDTVKVKDLVVAGEIKGSVEIGENLISTNTDSDGSMKIIVDGNEVFKFHKSMVTETAANGFQCSGFICNGNASFKNNTIVYFYDGYSGTDIFAAIQSVSGNGRLTLYQDGAGGSSNISVDGSANLDIDSPGTIILDSDAGQVTIKDNGVNRFFFDGANNRFRIYNSTNVADFLTITVGAEGATTIATTDADTAVGHLTLDVDGDITLDSDTGVFIAKKAGTEFSAANSAYAGMILGYTRLRGNDTLYEAYEIQNDLTVESADHQITFITPPSENVEIECSVYINIISTDTKIHVGVSDNSTYNSIGEQFEYDVDGIFFTDDEADKHNKTFKFVLGANELEAIGVSNTFYIGFSTGGATKSAYINYGLRASHGLAYPPFIIKATALPATIYDAQ